MRKFFAAVPAAPARQSQDQTLVLALASASGLTWEFSWPNTAEPIPSFYEAGKLKLDVTKAWTGTLTINARINGQILGTIKLTGK